MRPSLEVRAKRSTRGESTRPDIANVRRTLIKSTRGFTRGMLAAGIDSHIITIQRTHETDKKQNYRKLLNTGEIYNQNVQHQ